MSSFKYLAVAAALASVSFSASASTMSATLDFDNPVAGFEFSTTQNSGNISIVNGNCAAGSCLSIRAAAGGETVTLERTDGGAFSISSLWFQLLGNGNDGNTLRVASDQGDSIDFAVPAFAHNTGFTQNLNFAAATSFTFSNLNRGGIRVDDITVSYEIAPVPLPAAGFLLLASLAGLSVLRRRS